VRSIFNLSKSILKSREAFPILDGGIRKNLREGILKSEKAFSTLDETKRNISIQACVILNFHKIISNLDKKRRARKKALQIYLDGILKTLIVSVSVAMIFSPKPRERN
jgi:hypothetical protein